MGEMNLSGNTQNHVGHFPKGRFVVKCYSQGISKAPFDLLVE